MDIGQVVLGIAPALFTLVGALVGSALTFQSARMHERLKQDEVARAALLDVSNAVHRLAWRNKVGALSPEDALPVGTGSIADSLLTSAKDARKALIGAGVPYRVAAMALDPIDRLVVRQGQMKVHETDTDDAQELVSHLLDLLDRGRWYRRSRLALARLRGMSELKRGARDIEGGFEHQNLGYSPIGAHAPDQSR
jgi:hypothetical protein